MTLPGLADGGRGGGSCQVRWTAGMAWTVSWMGIHRVDQNPSRGPCSSCRARRNSVNVTAAATSHAITPTARTDGVDPTASR
jgi:hypothetical protein